MEINCAESYSELTIGIHSNAFVRNFEVLVERSVTWRIVEYVKGSFDFAFAVSIAASFHNRLNINRAA